MHHSNILRTISRFLNFVISAALSIELKAKVLAVSEVTVHRRRVDADAPYAASPTSIFSRLPSASKAAPI